MQFPPFFSYSPDRPLPPLLNTQRWLGLKHKFLSLEYSILYVILILDVDLDVLISQAIGEFLLYVKEVLSGFLCSELLYNKEQDFNVNLKNA